MIQQSKNDCSKIKSIVIMSPHSLVHHGAVHNCEPIRFGDWLQGPISDKERWPYFGSFPLDKVIEQTIIAWIMRNIDLCLTEGSFTLLVIALIMNTLSVIIMCTITQKQCNDGLHIKQFCWGVWWENHYSDMGHFTHNSHSFHFYHFSGIHVDHKARPMSEEFVIW